MRLKTMYPDYPHSIWAIVNALLHHYGVQAGSYHLPKLKRRLRHNHKNVVLIILDGMGVDMMQHQLGRFSFLRRHIKDKITSVFPTTTVAATTTYYSGLQPVEHSWLGWSPYFSDLGRVVELYTNKDFYTGEPVGEKVVNRLPYQHIFERIRAVNPAVQLTEVFPNYIKPDGVLDFEEMSHRIVAQTQEEGEQFVLAYWTDPDHTSHEFGPYSIEVGKVLQNLNTILKKTCADLKDTLVIISADHGHIENTHEVFLNDYPDLMDCLSAPLGLDMRAQTVFLKSHKREKFESLFEKYLSDDFLLVKSEEAISKGLFGMGKIHPKCRAFLGDYLIVAKGEKTLVQRFPNDVYKHLLGVHSGLTNFEMLVPLILIEKG